MSISNPSLLDPSSQEMLESLLLPMAQKIWLQSFSKTCSDDKNNFPWTLWKKWQHLNRHVISQGSVINAGFLSSSCTTACLKWARITPADRPQLIMARTDCPLLESNSLKNVEWQNQGESWACNISKASSNNERATHSNYVKTTANGTKTEGSDSGAVIKVLMMVIF